MIGPVKVWKLPPGEFNRVLQNPGMELGKPDRVFQPPSALEKMPPTLLKKVGRERKKASKAGGTKKPKITREKYLQLVEKGLNEDQICERVNMTRNTLLKYLREWKKAEREVAAGR
ncbi:helix-turn-helix domain-containing protein [Cohnella sp. AR92]|uniref:helix-turn-helix domain-containing protein n=1 Tax=Cohnella sp. AR92 TaxID=648716 RepID=UPI000F8EC4ED|nr:helix-turn-helix domain-containing protein [Cohnella sp. AR92]RUS42240.1 hypothetical protein ELR57_26875 [Cohnella sp. AR92]